MQSSLESIGKISRRAVLSAALFVASGLGAAMAQDEIRIGAIFPFTGPASVFGNQNFQGVDIAADVVNDRGGIGGRKVVLIRGDASSTQAAASETSRLATREGVEIFLGSSTSSVAMVASQEAERNGAFYWEGMGVANDITERGFRYLFRFGMNAAGLGEPAAAYSVEVLSTLLGIAPTDMKIAILHEDSGFGTDVSLAARRLAEKAGAQIVMSEGYSARSTDLSSAVLRLRSTAPDVVIVTQFINDAILLQRQMEELNVRPKAFLGTGAGQATVSFAEALGDKVNGIFSSSYPPDVNSAGLSEKAQSDLVEFKRRYEEKYGQTPAVQESLGFVVGIALMEDIIGKAASLEPADLAATARAADVPLGSYINGWGMLFDEKGQNVRASAAVVQWQDEAMVVVHPVDVKLAEPIMVPLPGSN